MSHSTWTFSWNFWKFPFFSQSISLTDMKALLVAHNQVFRRQIFSSVSSAMSAAAPRGVPLTRPLLLAETLGNSSTIVLQRHRRDSRLLRTSIIAPSYLLVTGSPVEQVLERWISVLIREQRKQRGTLVHGVTADARSPIEISWFNLSTIVFSSGNFLTARISPFQRSYQIL